MKDHTKLYSVTAMCRALDVSRSGYYKWCRSTKALSEKQREDAVLKMEIRKIHKDSKKTYGRPRLHQKLQQEGHECGKNRLVRLMKEEGIEGVQKKRFRIKTTDSNHPYAIAPNRLKGHPGPTGPDEIWLADITYVRTQEGWTYLAAVLDMFSRKIVGWAMSERIDHYLTMAALKNALRGRKIPAIHHSDRGSQYACHEYRDLLRGCGIKASMSRKGNPYDNATMESFFGTLKAEEVQGTLYSSREAARREIFAYIEAFYNTTRIHTSLTGLSPNQYETEHFTERIKDNTGPGRFDLRETQQCPPKPGTIKTLVRKTKSPHRTLSPAS
jgi:transposase InsO family protein